jgi:hypothetical protein
MLKHTEERLLAAPRGRIPKNATIGASRTFGPHRCLDSRLGKNPFY